MKLYDIGYYLFIIMNGLILLEYWILAPLGIFGPYLMLNQFLIDFAEGLLAYFIWQVVTQTLPIMLLLIYILSTRKLRIFEENGLNNYAIVGIINILIEYIFAYTRYSMLIANDANALDLDMMYSIKAILNIGLFIVGLIFLSNVQHPSLKQFRLWYIVGFVGSNALNFVLAPIAGPGGNIFLLYLLPSTVFIILSFIQIYYLWKYLRFEEYIQYDPPNYMSYSVEATEPLK